MIAGIGVLGFFLIIAYWKIKKLEEDNETLHYTIYGINRKQTQKNPKGGLIDRVEKLEEK